jgi:hypothetical protein
VFAVLTDGTRYRFFVIDERDRAAYSSVEYTVDQRRFSDLRNNPDLIEILSIISWFIDIITAISPRSSPDELDEEISQKRLVEIRKCFRPR